MADDDEHRIHIETHNQIGGLNIGQINVNPRQGWRDIRRSPGDVQGVANIIAGNPGRRVRFRVPMGDHEAMYYATQIRDLLSANGIAVEDFISEGAGGRPLPKLSWMHEGDDVVIQVGNQTSPVQPDGSA